MAGRSLIRVLSALAVLALVALATPPARAQDATFQGLPTLVPVDSDGDGRVDTARVTQVVKVPEGNTTSTVAGYLFPPTVNPNASWSGWVDALSVTQNITCASASGCNRTFNLDLRAGSGAAGTYVVVLNVTRSPTLSQSIVKGSAVGGTFPDAIALDDGGYFQYRETIDPAIAEIAYRSTSGSSGVNTPKNRTWGGSSWTAETELPTAGSPIRAIRVAWSPIALDERILVTQSDDGWLDAYVCTATCNVTNNIGQVWTAAPGTPERRFDVAYESLSGEALLVYGVLASNSSRDLAYRTYRGGVWSAEQYLDDTGHTTDVQYTLVKLAAKAGSDAVGLAAGDDTNNDVNAWVWDGTAFGSAAEITASARSPNEQEADLAWESASGDLVVVAAQAGSTNIASREFTTNWSTAVPSPCVNTAAGLWLSLKSNPVPTANDMVLAASDSGSDLSTCYWNGTAWANRTLHDTSLDFNTARSFDFAWGDSDSAGLLVYGTSVGQVTFRSFTAPNAWGTPTSTPMGTNPHRWVQLRTNPPPAATGVTVLGAVLEDGTNDLGTISWNGTGLTAGAADLTGDTGTGLFESFDFAPAGPGLDRLLVRYTWTNVSSAASHTLIVKGYRADEDVDVQVLTPPATWVTRLTITSTVNTRYAYTLTGAEYDGGSPSVRIVDRGGLATTSSDLWIDWIAVRGDGASMGAARYGTVALNPSPGSTPFGFEFGMNPTTLAVILVPAALVAVILARRRRRRGPRPSSVAHASDFEEEDDLEEDETDLEDGGTNDQGADLDADEPGQDDRGGQEDGDLDSDDTDSDDTDSDDTDSDEPEYEEPPVQTHGNGDRRTKYR